MTIKITSPTEGLNGKTSVGGYELVFKDGVAEVEDLNDGATAWLKKHGYGIDGAAKPVEREVPQPPDPRYVGTEKVGTPLRDGAVDPAPGDFLGPTNAGEANPHGTEVVNPEIHASEGVRPVKPGDVHVDDPEAQNAAETAHAVAATDGTPITDGATVEVDLKGAALDEALEAANLPKSGTADEKRARLAEHQAGA